MISRSATKFVFVTIMITFCVLAFLRIVDVKDFKDVVMIVVSFYFGNRTQRNNEVLPPINQ